MLVFGVIDRFLCGLDLYTVYVLIRSTSHKVDDYKHVLGVSKLQLRIVYNGCPGLIPSIVYNYSRLPRQTKDEIC